MKRAEAFPMRQEILPDEFSNIFLLRIHAALYGSLPVYFPFSIACHKNFSLNSILIGTILFTDYRFN